MAKTQNVLVAICALLLVGCIDTGESIDDLEQKLVGHWHSTARDGGTAAARFFDDSSVEFDYGNGEDRINHYRWQVMEVFDDRFHIKITYRNRHRPIETLVLGKFLDDNRLQLRVDYQRTKWPEQFSNSGIDAAFQAILTRQPGPSAGMASE